MAESLSSQRPRDRAKLCAHLRPTWKRGAQGLGFDDNILQKIRN
jgi:hypothetical protein